MNRRIAQRLLPERKATLFSGFFARFAAPPWLDLGPKGGASRGSWPPLRAARLSARGGSAGSAGGQSESPSAAPEAGWLSSPKANGPLSGNLPPFPAGMLSASGGQHRRPETTKSHLKSGSRLSACAHAKKAAAANPLWPGSGSRVAGTLLRFAQESRRAGLRTPGTAGSRSPSMGEPAQAPAS